MIEVFQKAIFQKEISSGERELQENGQFDLVALFDALGEMCAWAKQPIVLLIDEIDSASNNQVFLDFLVQLRVAYLEREEIADYLELREILYAILFGGQSFPFNPDHAVVEIGTLFGFIKTLFSELRTHWKMTYKYTL